MPGNKEIGCQARHFGMVRLARAGYSRTMPLQVPGQADPNRIKVRRVDYATKCEYAPADKPGHDNGETALRRRPTISGLASMALFDSARLVRYWISRIPSRVVI